MPILHHDELKRMAAALLEAAGCHAEEAETVAANLVEANLKGHDSHGLANLPTYLGELKSGQLKPNREPVVVLDEGPFMVADAGRGLGQSVTGKCMRLAMAKTREMGIAVLAIRNSGHMGRIGAFAEQGAQAGLISLHFVNAVGHPPYVAPPASPEPRFSTNPFCFAVPATEGTPAIVLDCATSKVAWGKLKVAFNKAEQVADGLLLDPQGRPTRDPAVMVPDPLGAMLPFGEHKGFGLALLCELLGGALTGGDTVQPGNPRDGVTINNMLSILIDPARLGGIDRFRRESDAVVAYLRSARPLDAANPVLLAGEPERLTMAKRIQDGISIDPRTWRELQEAARSVGVELEE